MTTTQQHEQRVIEQAYDKALRTLGTRISNFPILRDLAGLMFNAGKEEAERWAEIQRQIALSDHKLWKEDFALRLRIAHLESTVEKFDRDKLDAEWYSTCEFEAWQEDEMCFSVSGPREDALKEALNYAQQYAEDGAVRVFEVRRVLVLDTGMEKSKGEGK